MSDNNLLNENPVLYFKQKRERALEEAPALIDGGHNLIYPELCEEWDKLVQSSVNSIYYGDEVKEALKIMISLSCDDSMEGARAIYHCLDKANVSPGFKALTLNIVRDFSKKGPEFWLAITPGEISVDDLRTLTTIQKRNNVFAQQYVNEAISGKK